MGLNDFSVESPTNFEEKSICCFVVDVSGSMDGEPIRQLNAGLQQFHADIGNDSTMANRLEVAVVEFSHITDVMVSPALVEDFDMPTLQVKGSTALVDGVREAISLVDARKTWYKDNGLPYKRPWIILITDGAPDTDQDVDGLEAEIESATNEKKFVFLPIGVEHADMSVLNRISGYSPDGSGKKMPAMKLSGLKFEEFFSWVSSSMEAIGASKDGDSISLPSPTDWMDGFSV